MGLPVDGDVSASRNRSDSTLLSSVTLKMLLLSKLGTLRPGPL
jgi:hypothetical protein